jgi:hypothetical protein
MFLFVAIYKAMKMEIKFLCEAEMSDKEIVEWVLSALDVYCDYQHGEVKVLEVHDRLMCKPGDDLPEA